MKKKTHARERLPVKEGSGISIEQKPFSAKELAELKKIINNKKYWERAYLKSKFCAANNRVLKEVSDYIRYKAVRAAQSVTDNSENVTPKPQSEPVRKRKGEPEKTQIRIKGLREGSIRMNNGELIIEL